MTTPPTLKKYSIVMEKDTLVLKPSRAKYCWNYIVEKPQYMLKYDVWGVGVKLGQKVSSEVYCQTTFAQFHLKVLLEDIPLAFADTGSHVG